MIIRYSKLMRMGEIKKAVITRFFMLLMMGEMKEEDGLPCSDWCLYTDMVKLIISQLDDSITLIHFTTCLSLAELD